MSEKLYLGAMPPKKDLRDYKYSPATAINPDDLPNQFELWTPQVKNQGAVGSCVAHVSSEIEEYFNYEKDKSTTPLSPGYIYGCRYDYTGEGMYLRDALKTLQKRGIAEKNEFDYNEEVPKIIELFKEKEAEGFKTDSINTINNYFSINEKSVNDIKKCLMTYGPVMVSIKWYNNFYDDGERLIGAPIGPYGNHCVMIYGWNEKGWLVQNSWGTSWGKNGKFIYPFNYEINEAWGIVDNLEEDKNIKVVNPQKNKVYNIILKICNFIYNQILKK